MGLLQHAKNVVYESYRAEDYSFRRLGALRAYDVFSPQLIARILKDKAHFVQPAVQRQITSRIIGHCLINSPPEIWEEKRKLFRPFFTPHELLEHMGPVIIAESEKLAREWETRAETTIDLEHEMRVLSGRIILRALFGESISDQIADDIIGIISRAKIESFRGLSAAGHLFRIFGLHNLSEKIRASGGAMPAYYRGESYRQDRADLDALIQPVIDERRHLAVQPHDLLGLMLRARTDNKAAGLFGSDEDIRNEILMFIVAGHDTTAVGLSFSLIETIKNPALMAKIHQEIGTITQERCLEPVDYPRLPTLTHIFIEAVRRYPPSHTIGSEVIAHQNIDGIKFKKGDLVKLNLAKALSHAPTWDNPAFFNAERMASQKGFACPRNFVAFGEGQRVCPGMPLTFIEATLGLGTIFSRVNFKPETLIEPDGVENTGFSARIVGTASCEIAVT